MAQRKVSILDKAAQEVAHVAYFIESKWLPETAKRFVSDAFHFFESLGDDRVKYKPCSYIFWRMEEYRCAHFKKKFIVTFLDTETEIIVCDFAAQQNIKAV